MSLTMDITHSFVFDVPQDPAAALPLSDVRRTCAGILIISDSGGAANTNTDLIVVGPEDIDLTNPGLRVGAGLVIGGVDIKVNVNEIFCLSSAAGQKLSVFCFG